MAIRIVSSAQAEMSLGGTNEALIADVEFSGGFVSHLENIWLAEVEFVLHSTNWIVPNSATVRTLKSSDIHQASSVWILKVAELSGITAFHPLIKSLGGFKCAVKLTSLNSDWFFGVECHLIFDG